MPLWFVLCAESRRARRGCPALGQQICAVCCGTKRLVEIQCPADCPWLASAREHPPAAAVRQQQRDIASLVQFMRDFNERQSQLFFLIARSFGYEPPDLQPLIDDDVAEAAAALASTFETASRGVIYEHRPASLAGRAPGRRLKPMLAEAGKAPARPSNGTPASSCGGSRKRVARRPRGGSRQPPRLPRSARPRHPGKRRRTSRRRARPRKRPRQPRLIAPVSRWIMTFGEFGFYEVKAAWPRDVKFVERARSSAGSTVMRTTSARGGSSRTFRWCGR